MAFFQFILSYIAVVLMGSMIASFALRRDANIGWTEKIFIGFGLGSGLQTYIMFLTGIAGIPFSFTLFFLLDVLIAALFAVFLYHAAISAHSLQRERVEASPSFKFVIAAALTAWVALKIGFVFYENLARPIYTWDAWIHWAPGAKLFFYEKGFLLGSEEHYFGKSYRYPGHPMLFTLLQIWSALSLGEFHEIYVKFWSFLFFVGILGLTYFSLKTEVNRFHALVTIFLLSGFPLMTFHGTDAYSDLPLGFYALAGTIFLYRYLNTQTRIPLILSAFFFSMAALTKNEGLFFPLSAGVVILTALFTGKGFRKKDLFIFVLVFVAFFGPWFLFKFVNGFGYGHGQWNVSGNSALPSKLAWFSDPTFSPNTQKNIHWEVLPIYLKENFFSANYGLLFPSWLLISLFLFREIISTNLKYLYLYLFSIISMFIFVYLTLEVTAVTQVSGLHRNTLTFAPIILYVLSLLCRPLITKSAQD